MKEEKDVIQLKNQLTEHQMSVFNSEMVKYRKNTGIAYVLLIILGTLGAHKFYIGKIGMGVFYLLLGITAWVSLVIRTAGVSAETRQLFLMTSGGGEVMSVSVFIMLVCLGLLGINLLIDLFTMPKQIKRIYENQELEVLHRLIGEQKIEQERVRKVNEQKSSVSPEPAVLLEEEKEFPMEFKCPECQKKLKVTHPGRFRCVNCNTLLTIDQEGHIT